MHGEEENFRNTIEQADSIGFGCSHTWGVGVEATQTWCHVLGAKNYGVRGVSADLIVRIARTIVPEELPKRVYCLWPDWSRFEYQLNCEYLQSLPTDKDRVLFMPTHDDAWCRANFAHNLDCMQQLCDQHGVELIGMTLYDLIPYIDHADRWPLSTLGHHYAPEWHQWVADLFARARDEKFKFPLAYE